MKSGVVGGDAVEQAVAGSREHVIDVLEAVGAAVVGVGDVEFAFRRAVERGVEGAHEADAGFGRAGVEEMVAVRAVHGEDEFEALEVGAGVEPACDGDEFDTVGAGDGCGACVGAFADVPRAGAAGIDLESVAQAACMSEVEEDALGERGSADVAEADEEERAWRRFVVRAHAAASSRASWFRPRQARSSVRA